MKKTYQNPTMIIVKIQTVHMIADSLTIGDSVTTTSGAESRRRGRSSWSDDEDYDE